MFGLTRRAMVRRRITNGMRALRRSLRALLAKALT
jgi:hypothetical protein